MHQPAPVGRGQARAHLHEHLHALAPARPRTPGRSHSLSVRPCEQLHGHEGLPLDLTHLVHLHDVGVRQLGQRLSLAPQPGRLQPLIEILVQHLERHAAIERGIEGLEHYAHAASA